MASIIYETASKSADALEVAFAAINKFTPNSRLVKIEVLCTEKLGTIKIDLFRSLA
jgi:hypothetical protein